MGELGFALDRVQFNKRNPSFIVEFVAFDIDLHHLGRTTGMDLGPSQPANRERRATFGAGSDRVATNGGWHVFTCPSRP